MPIPSAFASLHSFWDTGDSPPPNIITFGLAWRPRTGADRPACFAFVTVHAIDARQGDILVRPGAQRYRVAMIDDRDIWPAADLKVKLCGDDAPIMTARKILKPE
jgi:hypothetical protein